jgi:murein DD-endopeptidase MepM/ murein hydrolase activator NlpD
MTVELPWRVSTSPRVASACVVLLACGLSALCVVDAGAQSGARSARDSIRSRIRQAQTGRNAALSEAETLRRDLRLSQERLKRAKADVEEARAGIHAAKEGIRDASRAADVAQENLVKQRRILDTRMVAMYKAGTSSYADVVLGARSFTEITSRPSLCGRIIEGDVALMREIEQAKADAQAKGEELRSEQQRLEAEEARLALAQRAIAAETERREGLLARQNAMIHQMDAELAQLESASRALTQEIRGGSGAGNRSYAPSQAWSGGWQRPCGGTISSRFGPRGGRRHEGIDICAAAGTPVGSAGGGVVCKASYGYNGGYGNMVVVNHGNGRTTVYAHMSSINVSVGQQVSAGQALGGVGSTGRSTGNHVHFETRVNGSPVDPLGGMR